MSDKPPLNSESPLPEDLSSVESRLQQFGPVVTTVNRDALMYEAGWAAAHAKLDTSTSLRLWQAAAGVLAASLLMALTPLTLQESPSSVSVSAPEIVANAEHEPKTFEPESSEAAFGYTTYLRSTAPLLVRRGRALNQDFSELPNDSSSRALVSPTLTTNRKLLEELLPRTSTPAVRPPSISLWNSGEPT